MRASFVRGAADADVAIVEGAMGLFACAYCGKNDVPLEIEHVGALLARRLRSRLELDAGVPPLQSAQRRPGAGGVPQRRGTTAHDSRPREGSTRRRSRGQRRPVHHRASAQDPRSPVSCWTGGRTKFNRCTLADMEGGLSIGFGFRDPPSKIGRKLKNPVGMVILVESKQRSNLKAAPTR